MPPGRPISTPMKPQNGRKTPLYLVTDEPTAGAATRSGSITQQPAPASSAAAPNAPSASKILTRDQLLARRADARETGRRVVHCHGCFDIVHPGHLRHLRHAKAQGGE